MGNEELRDVEIEDAAISFEAIKTFVRQNKDGVVVSFAIDAANVPSDIFTSPIGSRFYCSIVQISDDEQPIAPVRKARGKKAVNMACMLCRNQRFQNWLYSKNYCTGVSEKDARIGILTACGVDHRSDLSVNELAQSQFFDLVEQFQIDSDRGLA